MSEFMDDWRKRKDDELRRSVEQYNASYGVESTSGPVCPHCGNKIEPDEGFHYREYDYVEDECGSCDKKFRVELNVTYTWTTYREMKNDE